MWYNRPGPDMDRRNAHAQPIKPTNLRIFLKIKLHKLGRVVSSKLLDISGVKNKS